MNPTDANAPNTPSGLPTAGSPRPKRRWTGCVVAIAILVPVYLVAQHHFTESAIRLDLRHALGVEKGDDGFKPRAAVAYPLKPAPPESLERLARAPRATVEKLLHDHFQAMAESKDWHILDDRTVLRRIRALDLATTLGVTSIRPLVEEIARKCADGANHYSYLPPDNSSADQPTTGIAIIRDRQFRDNARRLEQAARKFLLTLPPRSS